jgi:hypothetical protein
MITKNKLQIYANYNGDLDMWLRTGKKSEKEMMTSADWHLIDTLIQDCVVLERGLGSDSRNAEAIARLNESCEGMSTVEYLKEASQ